MERETGKMVQKGVVKLYVLLNTPTMLGHHDLTPESERMGTTKLTLVLDDHEEGKDLHARLVTQMIEHRGVQITHHTT